MSPFLYPFLYPSSITGFAIGRLLVVGQIDALRSVFVTCFQSESFGGYYLIAACYNSTDS